VYSAGDVITDVSIQSISKVSTMAAAADIFNALHGNPLAADLEQ